MAQYSSDRPVRLIRLYPSGTDDKTNAASNHTAGHPPGPIPSGYGAELNRSIDGLYPLWRSRIALWIVFQRRLLLIAARISWRWSIHCCSRWSLW